MSMLVEAIVKKVGNKVQASFIEAIEGQHKTRETKSERVWMLLVNKTATRGGRQIRHLRE